MQKVVDKVRKLQQLAGSDNEHEAACASRKAQELIDQHNLSPARLAAKTQADFDMLMMAQKLQQDAARLEAHANELRSSREAELSRLRSMLGSKSRAERKLAREILDLIHNKDRGRAEGVSGLDS